MRCRIEKSAMAEEESQSFLANNAAQRMSPGRNLLGLGYKINVQWVVTVLYSICMPSYAFCYIYALEDSHC